jgi:hypothetical protein
MREFCRARWQADETSSFKRINGGELVFGCPWRWREWFSPSVAGHKSINPKTHGPYAHGLTKGVVRRSGRLNQHYAGAMPSCRQERLLGPNNIAYGLRTFGTMMWHRWSRA